MNKLSNFLKYLISTSVGGLTFFLGGWDSLLKSILCMVILDFITGILKSVYNKKLSSDICIRGIVKKISIFVVIAVSNFVQGILDNDIPLRETIIVFYIVNEACSILENISLFIPIPPRISEALQEVNNENNKESE